MRPIAILTAVIAAAAFSACHGRTVAVTAPCPVGHDRVGRACFPRFDTCADDAVPALGGGCRKVGVPSTSCAPGFFADDKLGCAPRLPPGPCVPGYLGVPGDALCHATVVCPTTTGRWDGIPVDANTLYVDVRYTGGGSDGSAERPFLSIHEAIDARTTDVTIAIAPGTYSEHIEHRDFSRTVKFWGRCPKEVEIDGPSPDRPVVDLRAPAEMHGIAVTGGSVGIAIAPGGRTVLLDGIWLHDDGQGALEMNPGPSAIVTLRNSLIEKNTKMVELKEGKLIVVRSVIRGQNLFSPDGSPGIDNFSSDSDLTVEQSLIEETWGAGIDVHEGKAMVRGSVIRRVNKHPADKRSVGVRVSSGSVTVLDSYLESNVDAALDMTLIALPETATTGEVRIERTVFRPSDLVGAGPEGERGLGINALLGNITIVDSLFDGLRYGAIDALQANVTIEGSLIRSTSAANDGLGFGVRVGYQNGASKLIMKNTVVISNTYAGVVVDSSQAELTGCVVRRTKHDVLSHALGHGLFVRAIAPQPYAEVKVRESVFSDNEGSGVGALGGLVTVTSSALRCNASPVTKEAVDVPPIVNIASSVCGCSTNEVCP